MPQSMTPDEIRKIDDTHVEGRQQLNREEVAIFAEIRDALLKIVKYTEKPRSSIFEQTFGR